MKLLKRFEQRGGLSSGAIKGSLSSGVVFFPQGFIRDSQSGVVLHQG